MVPTHCRRALRRLRRTWPYVLVEVLVPGGTVLALLLWLSSGQAKGQFGEQQAVPDNPSAISVVVGLRGPLASPTPAASTMPVKTPMP